MFVSVIITTRNRPESLLRAIRSVFAQTYSCFDFHIVDDGSDDENRIMFNEGFSEEKEIFIWHHGINRGLSAARNTGIKNSKGDFIAFLDDDDEWKPDSLKTRIELIEGLTVEEFNTLGVVYSGCEVRIIDENRITYNMPRIEGDIAKGIQKKGLNTIPSSGMFPRKVIEKIGGFDETLVSSVDHDIWMSLGQHGMQAFAVHEPLTITYASKGRKQMVSDTNLRVKGVEQFLEKWESLYEDWFGLDVAQRKIQDYRTNVLGNLAAKKFFDKEFEDVKPLLFHIIKNNGLSTKQNIRLTQIFLKYMVRFVMPLWLIKLGKYNQKVD